MKPLNLLKLAVGVLMFTPTLAQDNLNKNSDDGIYATPSTSTSAKNESTTAPPSVSNRGNSTIVNPTDTSSNNLQGANDYYNNNYDYSSQIRRYDDDWGDWNYYDDIYTNSYWYSGNPYQYGMSIYMGDPCWGPAYYGYMYDPSLYWGLGCGWGLGYGWGYPYCGWGLGLGWGGYGYGWGGYGCGWGGYGYGGWGGYGCGYYNSYEPGNNYYYGPRNYIGSRTFNNGLERSGSAPVPNHTGAIGGHVSPVNNNRTIGGQRSFGESYQSAIHAQAATHPGEFTSSARSMSNNALHVPFSNPAVSGTNRYSNSSSFSANHVSMSYDRPGANRGNMGGYRSGTGYSGYNHAAGNYRSAGNYGRSQYGNYARAGNYSRYGGGNQRYNSGGYGGYRNANSQQRMYSGFNGGRSSYNAGRGSSFGGHSFSSGASRGFSGGGRSFGGGGHSFGGGGGHSFGGGGGGFSGGGHGGGGFGGGGHR